MNRTELYQLCTRAGILVQPDSTKDWMIRYLIGDLKPPDLPDHTNPANSWRYAIQGFLGAFWLRVQPMLKCPAKMLRNPDNPDPRPCFRCLDMQVIACAEANKKNDQRMREYLR